MAVARGGLPSQRLPTPPPAPARHPRLRVQRKPPTSSRPFHFCSSHARGLCNRRSQGTHRAVTWSTPRRRRTGRLISTMPSARAAHGTTSSGPCASRRSVRFIFLSLAARAFLGLRLIFGWCMGAGGIFPWHWQSYSTQLGLRALPRCLQTWNAIGMLIQANRSNPLPPPPPPPGGARRAARADPVEHWNAPHCRCSRTCPLASLRDCNCPWP